jgi:hypothetical protein
MESRLSSQTDNPLDKARHEVGSHILAGRRRRLRESRRMLYDQVINLALTVWGKGPAELEPLRTGQWGPGAPPEVVVALVGEALAGANGGTRDDASWVVVVPVGQQEAIEERASNALMAVARHDSLARKAVAELPEAADLLTPLGDHERKVDEQSRPTEQSPSRAAIWKGFVHLFVQAVPGRSRRLRLYWSGLALALGMWGTEPSEWLDRERRVRARSAIELAGEALSSRTGKGLGNAGSLVAHELEEAQSERLGAHRGLRRP